MAFALDFVRGMDEEGLKHLLEQAEVNISIITPGFSKLYDQYVSNRFLV